METTLISTLFKTEIAQDSIITVQGWVKTLRDSKSFAFIELNDGSYFKNLQIVCDESLDNFKEITKISLGSSLTIVGELIATPGMKQPFELKAQEVIIQGICEADFPLQKKRHSFEYLRTIAHLRPRTNTFYAVFRIRSLAAQAVHRYFHDRGFVYIHTPIITTSDAEGAGEMFQVTTLDINKPSRTQTGDIQYKDDFFGKHASLTVSGQLNVEAFCMAFRNVYTFGPTFRAENSNTPRHAAEFWMIEPEVAFADMNDIMDLEEDMTRSIISEMLVEAPEEMAFLNQFVDKSLIQRLEHLRD
ncbi:MAG: asparagine--tRNA ligase, partial [Clostridiales bacterium]|nr:asparagine--tRNA ligase [Clostridiales bacterium]